MATLAEIRTWVSKRLQDPNNTSISASDVDALTNQAIRYWNDSRFFFNEVTDTATLTQGDATIPIPSHWLCPSIDNCFVIEYSGIRYPLKKVSEMVYNSTFLTNGVGQPEIFTKQANSGYQCYPIPDRAYTVRRFYLKEYNALSGDSDTNEFTTHAEDLIKYTAVAYGSRDFRQDIQMYQAFIDQANTEEQALINETRKNNATGSLTIYS
jgi:hypothetical protein|tara:strand:+ start:7504 stop:8133 length:630 start_codon:yes stop_codon:yes gene_type:complete